MLLCLDIGNTNIVVAEVSDRIENLFRFSTKAKFTKDDIILLV